MEGFFIIWLVLMVYATKDAVNGDYDMLVGAISYTITIGLYLIYRHRNRWKKIDKRYK